MISSKAFERSFRGSFNNTTTVVKDHPPAIHEKLDLGRKQLLVILMSIVCMLRIFDDRNVRNYKTMYT